MSAVVTELLILLSLSARRAWIEIVCEMRCFCVCVVALRKESVDRNRLFIIGQYLVSVALRKESVDRNRTPHHMNTRPIPSLSARRAWIEIALSPRNMTGMPVALRKESVDRNIKQVIKFLDIRVALRKESVDRNANPVLNA